MLSDLQTWLGPYLGVFGANLWLQAMVAIVGSLIIALIFDRVVRGASTGGAAAPP